MNPEKKKKGEKKKKKRTAAGARPASTSYELITEWGGKGKVTLAFQTVLVAPDVT